MPNINDHSMTAAQRLIAKLDKATADWDDPEMHDHFAAIMATMPGDKVKVARDNRWRAAEGLRRDVDAGRMDAHDAGYAGPVLARIDRMIVSAEAYRRNHPTLMDTLEFVRLEV